MSIAWKASLTVVLFLAAVAAGVILVLSFLTGPPTVDFTAAPGQPVNLTVQTVGSIGFGDHPQWVSYLVENPQGQWVHSTLWQVPAHTRINVTIYQYDSGSPLRNQVKGHVTGTIGDVASLNGRPFHVINSNAGNGVAHTFSIPTLGINIPLYGNPTTSALCGSAPCTMKSPHNVIKFSFMSPGPGNYPWQCFIPCGLGFLYGNGGPMSTTGFMAGFLEVQA